FQQKQIPRAAKPIFSLPRRRCIGARDDSVITGLAPAPATRVPLTHGRVPQPRIELGLEVRAKTQSVSVAVLNIEIAIVVRLIADLSRDPHSFGFELGI